MQPTSTTARNLAILRGAIAHPAADSFHPAAFAAAWAALKATRGQPISDDRMATLHPAHAIRPSEADAIPARPARSGLAEWLHDARPRITARVAARTATTDHNGAA
jgi:hypothetical protein